jgi:hypothetical protein
MHALPLLEASGTEIPFGSAFSGAVQIEICDRAAYDDFAFDLGRAKKISARLVEGGGNPLGDIDANRRTRPELFDFEKGGGVLFDMAVHPLNVLAVLGFRVSGVVEGFLGKPIRNQRHHYIPGVYERFGKESGEKSGETYGRAVLHMCIAGGNQGVATTIEAAKGGAATDGLIALSDEKYELRWETFPTEQVGKGNGSQLEIEELRTGKVIARSSLAADCYALIMEHISIFAKSGKREAIFLAEHAHVIGAILDIHEHARSQKIAAGEMLRQLKIDEPDIRKIALRNSNGMTVEITISGQRSSQSKYQTMPAGSMTSFSDLTTRRITKQENILILEGSWDVSPIASPKADLNLENKAMFLPKTMDKIICMAETGALTRRSGESRHGRIAA